MSSLTSADRRSESRECLSSREKEGEKERHDCRMTSHYLPFFQLTVATAAELFPLDIHSASRDRFGIANSGRSSLASGDARHNSATLSPGAL